LLRKNPSTTVRASKLKFIDVACREAGIAATQFNLSVGKVPFFLSFDACNETTGFLKKIGCKGSCARDSYTAKEMKAPPETGRKTKKKSVGQWK